MLFGSAMEAWPAVLSLQLHACKVARNLRLWPIDARAAGWRQHSPVLMPRRITMLLFSCTYTVDRLLCLAWSLVAGAARYKCNQPFILPHADTTWDGRRQPSPSPAWCMKCSAADGHAHGGEACVISPSQHTTWREEVAACSKYVGAFPPRCAWLQPREAVENPARSSSW